MPHPLPLRTPSFLRPTALALLLGLLLPAADATARGTEPRGGQDLQAATPPDAIAAPASPLPDEPSPDGLPQRLVLALDGVPHELFVEAQAEGLFRDFGPAARMVASFPSLSAVSFAAIGGTELPDGYQTMRYDADTNQVVGNTIATLSPRNHQNLPADNSSHSLMHRMIGYVTPYPVALRDLERIRRELLASRKAGFVAYLAQSDVILHVDGREAGLRFLRDLDAFLASLQADVRARTGRGLMVDLVSDHGSTLVKGRDVPLAQQLRRCGYRRNDRLDAPTDVAYSLAGIIGSVAVTAMPQAVEPVADCLARTDGVELVAVDRGERVGVLGADGSQAELWLVPGEAGASERYAYRALRGDPLGLLAPRYDAAIAGAESGAPTGPTAAAPARIFGADALFRATLDAPWPDPLRRLWRAFHGSVKEPSPILVSLADGREAGYRTVRAAAWLRGRGGTHGALTRRASLGILASNWRAVDDVDCWRAHGALFGAEVIIAARARADADRLAASLPAADAAPDAAGSGGGGAAPAVGAQPGSR
jgi:hypothetical protein